MFQTATPKVDNSYVAKAVKGDTKLDYKRNEVYGYAYSIHIDQLLLAYQYVPFIITFVILTAAPIYLCCLCCKCKRGKTDRHARDEQQEQSVPEKQMSLRERQRKKMSQLVEKAIKDNGRQTTIVAVVTLCSCFTVYNFLLDMISIGSEDTSDLPGHYEKNLGFYICTLIFATCSLSFLFIGIILFCVLLGIWSYGPRCCCFCKNEENQHIALLIPIVMCIGSTIISLSFHFQNILIAWSTDPFYASRIAVYYGIVIFVYYLTFRNTYFIPLVCKNVFTSQPSANTTHAPSPDAESECNCVSCCNKCIEKTWGCFQKATEEEEKERRKMRTTSCVVGLRILCVVTVGVLLSGFHALNAVFIYYIPINHSIEESINGVQIIYNGAVLLIGALIAYNVGWFYYHSTTFPAKAALQKAMKEMKRNPFGSDPLQYVEEGWDVLLEEDRMKEIMKALLIQVGKSKLLRNPT